MKIWFLYISFVVLCIVSCDAEAQNIEINDSNISLVDSGLTKDTVVSILASDSITDISYADSYICLELKSGNSIISKRANKNTATKSMLVDCYYLDNNYILKFTDDTEITVSRPSINYADSIKFEEFANNSVWCQSAARYGSKLVFVSEKLSSISLYDLNIHKKTSTLKLTPHIETTYNGGVLYHCNQCSFSNKKFAPTDPFPLLYVSMRADTTSNRCFIGVYRIIMASGKLSELIQVQTIYLPVITDGNALGNANVCIDRENNFMYTYSRNNNVNANNYQKCRITKFEIPDFHNERCLLNDKDILDSYELKIKAKNMQGAFISNSKLYIARGMKSAYYITINVIDLNKRELAKVVDLLHNGFTYEPEGCFEYQGHVMVTGKRLLFRLDI